MSDQKSITRQTLILFVFIVAMSLVPRFYNIADPATYHLHPIRQFQSLMVARNFYEQGMNLLDPRLDAGINQSVPRSPVALELQLMQYIAAGAYHVIGVKEWVGNVLAVLFFVGAAVFFFLIASKYLSTNYALLAALIFCFSPESFKYSRAFIPDFEVLFYALGSLFFFERYLISEQRKDYVLTLMFLALTFENKLSLCRYHYFDHGSCSIRPSRIHDGPIVVTCCGIPCSVSLVLHVRVADCRGGPQLRYEYGKGAGFALSGH